MGVMGESAKRVLLAKPRGYCAGVDRAVQTVEEALELYGAPIYVRKQIVHNKHVVATLEAQGRDLRRGERRGARGRDRRLLRARRRTRGLRPGTRAQPASHRRDLPAGHQGAQRGPPVRRRRLRHPADRPRRPRGGRSGPSGEAPAHIQLVDGPDGVDKIQVRDPAKVVWLSQTTLSVDETMETVDGCVRSCRCSCPAERRHLLRDLEPPVRGQGDRAASATS